MINRGLNQRLVNSRMFARQFLSSGRVMNSVFGSPKEGIYSNLPFTIKRKIIPFSVYYWGTLGFFFAFPFISTYLNLRKSGSLN